MSWVHTTHIDIVLFVFLFTTLKTSLSKMLYKGINHCARSDVSVSQAMNPEINENH